ncbi:hypothetical protein GCM10020331_008720 [Ectobacillus funiculus]
MGCTSGRNTCCSSYSREKNDLVITTVDLGTNVALQIASGGNIKGLGAQLPYENGAAQALVAGYSLLGKQLEPYYVVPSMKVTKENVFKGLEKWLIVKMHQKLFKKSSKIMIN